MNYKKNILVKSKNTISLLSYLIEKYEFVEEIDDKFLSNIQSFLKGIFDHYNDKVRANDY